MNNQLFLTIISSIFISGVAGYLGTLMLSKKMSVVADPLSHLAFPGAAIAIIYGFSLFIGVFPFILFGTFLIWILEKKTKLPVENLVAIIFAFGVGTTLLILPIDKAEEALVGNIAQITLLETLVAIFLSILVFYTTKFIYRKMMLINLSEDLAIVEGINVSLYNLLYLFSIAIVLGLGVYLVGGLITAALIAIPAASAKNITSDLCSYKIWAIIFGVLAAVIGIFTARFFSLPIGPAIVVVSATLFLISIFIEKKTF